MEPNASSYSQVDKLNNEKKKHSDHYQGKNSRYVLISLYLQKKSNHPTDLYKEKKCLNYFIYIPKFLY